MEKQNTIINNLIAILKTVVTDRNVKIVSNLDYSEQRDPYMVVVGISNIQNVNPLLKDYKFDLRILVDFFVQDDPEAHFFKKTRDQIWNYIQTKYLTSRLNFGEIEEGIVGMFLDGKTTNTNTQSNQCYIDLNVIGSWD